jgi:hypothetical protein
MDNQTLQTLRQTGASMAHKCLGLYSGAAYLAQLLMEKPLAQEERAKIISDFAESYVSEYNNRVLPSLPAVPICKAETQANLETEIKFIESQMQRSNQRVLFGEDGILYYFGDQ